MIHCVLIVTRIFWGISNENGNLKTETKSNIKYTFTIQLNERLHKNNKCIDIFY